MKLVRFGPPGKEKPGVLTDSGLLDVSSKIRDYDEAFFAKNGLKKLFGLLKTPGDSFPRISPETRLGPPVARPSKIICVGLNYADHAQETGAAVPSEPIIFFKSTTALSGPFDPIQIPRGSRKTDWEVELAVVIGKTARYVDLADAPAHLAGYCLHNDLSEREWQLERGGQWVKGKSCDTFAPLGPWLVTPDEAGNVDDLRLWLRVNGEMRQDSSTRQLIFKVPFLVHYISQFMTLLPGDVISTGTPPGVGLGMNPPVYLKKGDVVELGIEGLGTARQEVV